MKNAHQEITADIMQHLFGSKRNDYFKYLHQSNFVNGFYQNTEVSQKMKDLHSCQKLHKNIN